MILAEKFPNDLALHYYAGLWLFGNGRYVNAAVYLRAAIELQQLPQSERGNALKYLGLALLRAGRVVEAEIPLQSALKQTQPDMGAHCPLSEVYRQTGRLAESTRAEAECHNRV
jgi:Tfp pilus assembly protein PilF